MVIAVLAQSGEHGTVTAEVRGSKPLYRAKNMLTTNKREYIIVVMNDLSRKYRINKSITNEITLWQKVNGQKNKKSVV